MDILRKLRIFSCLIALGGVLGSGPGCERPPKATPQPASVVTTEEDTPEAVSAPAPPITGEKYNALLYDMSYRDVVAILGRECEEVEKDYVRERKPYGKTELRMWRIWRNQDGTLVRLCFVSDRLQKKTQKGIMAEEE